jgi:hypothetical protein
MQAGAPAEMHEPSPIFIFFASAGRTKVSVLETITNAAKSKQSLHTPSLRAIAVSVARYRRRSAARTLRSGAKRRP